MPKWVYRLAAEPIQVVLGIAGASVAEAVETMESERDVNRLDELREVVAGRRVTIVHYGEDIPQDPGYRPIRYGQLARWLMDATAEVTRIAPSFSHLAHSQRPMEWSGTDSEEGRIELVQTRSYASNRGLDRFRFLADFRSGTADLVARSTPADLYVVGYPPPGLVRGIRDAVGDGPKIVADIRDLWPDAQIPSGFPWLTSVASMVGRAMAKELRRTDAVVAMSPKNLQRAPVERRAVTIPLSISDRLIEAEGVNITGPMHVIFVGTFTQLFDFDALFDGWRSLVANRLSGEGVSGEGATVDGDVPRMTIVGGGPLEDKIRAFADATPSATFIGQVPSDEVPGLLAGADAGLVPLRAGQGGTLTNKVLEYLGTGAYVLHTLDDRVGRQFGASGTGVQATAASWADGLTSTEQRLGELRRDRAERRRRDIDAFGPPAIEPQWLEVFQQVLGPPTASG
jgi:hypothetical protein